MPDYGAKASAPGYDVRTVADFLLSFSSSWPLLKIEHAASATVTLNGTPQTIYTHDLGYPPMYIIIKDGMVVSFPPGIGVDNSVIAYDGNSVVGTAYTFYFYIFRLPLTQNYEASIIASSETRTAVDHDFGVKVTKPGASTSSNDMRDFAIHTSTRSPLLHKVDYGTLSADGGNFTRTVAHGLGYTPIGFCFIKFGTGLSGYDPDLHYSINGPQGTQDAYYILDSTNMYILEDGTFATSGGDATAVFLKDPFYKESVSMTYP